MTDTTVAHCLDYYARHQAALFPIPPGQKNPTGIVSSFAKDCSSDPSRWQAWLAANPGCNWGVVAGPSRWIIVDIDTKAQPVEGETPEQATTRGREAAWTLWCDLCASWGIPVAAPQVQSARGGWHAYFKLPDDIDVATLRQPDAIKGRINIRAGNGFVVSAGSYFEGLPYILLAAPDVGPYPAPAALIAHCTRATAPRPSGAANVGTRDRGDVATLLRFLVEHNAFAAYEDWVGVGMALKLEFGDDGLELWALTHDGTVTADVEATKWQSFATDAVAGSQTLNTWLARAHSLGWRGSVRKAASAMFDAVARLAQNAGATLPPGAPGPATGGVPMLAGQEVLCEVARPVLADFLASTADTPNRPANPDFPTLPDACSGHGLFNELRDAIGRVFALVETPPVKAARFSDVLAILSLVHVDTFDTVCRRLRTAGVTLPDRKVKLAATALADKVERAFVHQDNWIFDAKGFIENDNSDNVAVFLGILALELRWNAWHERAEIRGGMPGGELHFPEWTYIDDAVVAKLRTRGNRTKTRFRPSKEFFWESLLALAHVNTFDPAHELLDECAREWDGEPRLMLWLSLTCGVPCDPYHQAVARNIVGGMVRRIREPGCKHDFMPVFFGPQGTGKSTLAALLAVNAEWFSDEIMLGDSSKELVLSLAGKSVVEISEMGMRGSTNPNHVKAMLSRQIDRGRVAYGRTVTARPRRNIFIGTTNDDEPLVDPTGNRRFLPIRVDKEIDLVWLRENIRQVVGEAAALHAKGDHFGIPRDVWAFAAEHQEAARSASDSETLLNEWFAPSPYSGAVNYILAADLVWLTQLAGWRHGGANSVRGALMKKLGFKQEKPVINGKRTQIWVRKPENIKPADIVKVGVRYMVSSGTDGRPNVVLRTPDVTQGGTLPPITGAR